MLLPRQNDENKYLEHISDDEDYEDPALYERFKGTQRAEYFKKQKTSNDPELSDRISDDGLFNDLNGAAIDDGWDGMSVGDDQSETVTEEVRGRYRHKQTTLFATWKDSMKKLAKGYLSFLGNTADKPSTRKEEASAYIPCECPSQYRITSHIAVQLQQEFKFCGGCKTLPVALVEAGLFPLSPTKPSGAVHFGLCALLVRLRNVLAGSGEKISEFLSLQHQDFGKCLSAENCSNITILFSKMTELADEAVLKDVEEKAECSACPKASSSQPEDKRLIMLDGNFRLKGRRSLEEDHVLDKIDGFNNFNDVWLSNEDIAKFKHPSACIQASEKELNDKATLHIMYDIVCKLEPAIKREFPSLAGSGRLALSMFHAYAHVMHCQSLTCPLAEWMERLWSYMAKFITMTKSMLAKNRKYVLYMAVMYRNNAIKTNMVT
ncbi:hypothetical protein G6F56_007621 [Rhizopus delemar]|nr:hypothetical protein G6F56_007621 [Rhizopus delemar]